ncbi:hypothetical protein [Gemmatimonas sp.]|jgi:hypothetical protein|uniref:type I-G CRISPR-associated protein, Cas3-extension family n=1 Tax=Gemmatimonas sp. TaxID=1962908 RepID=UPI0037BFBA9E
MIRIRCAGLVPERLSAVLALIGVQRALAVSRPSWSVWSWWEGNDARPVLEVDTPTEQADVWEALLEGIRAHASALDFGGREAADYARAEWRALFDTGDALRGEVIAAIGSDAHEREWKAGTGLQPTPYCLMYGQGHQHFLKALAQVPRVSASPESREEFTRVLLEPWRYDRPGLSFRWDPADDRRYALRADDPSKGASSGNEAANRLAALGMLSLAPLPNERELLAPGYTRRGRQAVFAWPVWSVPSSVRGIRALMRHPYVLTGDGSAPAGVREVRVAERRSAGKFMVVSPGMLRNGA